ncbi:YhdP family protein [Rickettsiella endosymbiont of Miltochrista miniata]|uniref:YhdP family phospholipid transporter n=1 Tax=Rickettsiella endosymbiont of Miltochrista miniata TaxID=3066239 RepID=UPI00313B9CC6
MKQLLYSLSRLLIVFLTSSIVFFALVVVTGRILTPYLNKQVQGVSNLAARVLHKPVQIKQFSVAWQGLTPIFHGSDVIIWDDTRTYPLLSVKQLNIAIDIFHSLLSGSIKLAAISVNGIELVAHQTKDNQLVFTGISTLFDQSSLPNSNATNELIAWFLAEPQLSLDNVGLTFYPKSGPVWPPMRIILLLKNSGDRHQLSGRLRFVQEKLSEFSFKVDLKGSPLSSSQNHLSGPIYLHGENVFLDRWFNQWKPTLQLQNARTNFKIWADWQFDHFTQFQGLISSLQAASIKINKQPAITFLPFSTHILWQTTQQDSWSIDAIFHDFGVQAWQKIPGIQGLDTYLHMTPTMGNIIAHANDCRIDFNKLFKAPIHLDSLTSQLNWQQKDGEWIIQAPQFEATNQDVAVNSQFSLLISKLASQSQISLLAHIKIHNSTHIAYYLPQTLLGPELKHWLSTAINKGSGLGSLVLQGPTNQFPFDQHNGTFLVDAQITDANLNYQRAWPSLKKINGELIFSGRQMHVLIDTAELLNINLKNIKANIPIIKKNVQGILHIDSGEMNTRLEKGQAFLVATPLARRTLGQLKNLILAGPLQLSMQIAIPLESGKQKLNLLGRAQIENAKLKIPAHDIQLDQLTGPFTFNQDGVSAQKLTGILWKKPIELTIHSAPNLQIIIHYDDILTNLKPEQNGWRFSIDNQTAKGTVLIPNSNLQPILANFDMINLDSSIESNETNTWNFKQLPKINLSAREVRYKEINFGAVQLKLNPILGGVLVRELNAGDANYHLIASGAWHTQERNSTELIGQLDSANLSNFLRNWGLPASIVAEQAHMRFNLNWQGAPYQFSFTKLRGHFSFNATNGQIVDIGSSNEAKLNFGRLLTFLSIQSLTKRLQLDFSDLKTKGFDFTNLQGNFTLRNGNAITRDVTIEGPVASISIAGRIGMLNKDYDLVIKVVPHFTSSLPVIVGLAGGPVAGVVAWLANAVLGSTVQKIAQTSYHITGSWSKPDVVKTSA